MLTRRSPQSLTSPTQVLRLQPSPQLLVRRNVLTTCLHSGKARTKSGDAAPQIVIKSAGDVHIHGAAQAVEWDAGVARSPQANPLKSSAAHQLEQMHRLLGFEDVDDVRRLTPDLVAQLQLKPLQLDNLLEMLKQQQQKLGLLPEPLKPLKPLNPQQLPEEVGNGGMNVDRGLSMEGPRLHRAPQQQQMEEGKLEPTNEQHMREEQLQQPPPAAMDLVKRLQYRCWALTPDGRRVVSASGDSALAVHSTATGALLAEMEGKESMSQLPVCISPDGPTAVYQYTQRVWDIARIGLVAKGPGLHTLCVVVSPNGRQAVSGTADGAVWLWDLVAYTCIGKMREHSSRVNTLAITPDGLQAVSGGDDGTLRVWDLATRTCVATLKGHTAAVTCVAITPDGRRALSGSKDRWLRVWDLDNHTYRCVASMPCSCPVTCVAITPDGRHAVCAGEDSQHVSLRLRELATLAIIAEKHGAGSIASVLIAPDGRHASTVSPNWAMGQWDLAPYLDTATVK